MRSRFARVCLLSTALSILPGLAVTTASGTAGAQQPKGGAGKGKGKDKGDKADAKGDGKGKDAKGDGKGKDGKAVEVDLDEGKKPPAEEGPVQAGQPTEEMATAQRLFDGDKWAEAALALYRVKQGETGDDAGNKQIASYQLAVALYHLQFYQASYAIFADIANKPNHLRFNETLLWLAKLATTLPEPAEVVERVGKYSAEQVGRFNNKSQSDLFWQLNYMLGRHRYGQRNYEEAIQLFEKVEKKSRFYVQAQFFNGISYVQLKKSVPAVEAFQRIAQAIDDGVEGVEDEQRMRDLAYLSMARTYYSASIKLDPETNAPTVDEKRLSAAVKYWNKIDVASEYWLDGLFEEAWAYFMAGDYPRALGNIHTIKAPYFPNSFYPEADILTAQIYFATCQYDYAEITTARFKKKYEPIQKELAEIIGQYGAEGKETEAFEYFRRVKANKETLKPNVKPVVELALSDRQILRHLEYARILEEEDGRYKKAPPSFRESGLGKEVEDALDAAKTAALRAGGKKVQERFQRNQDEMSELLRDSAKILIDITAAKRTALEKTVEGTGSNDESLQIFGVVKPDEEHVLWPFDGEYWRDELGFYRQVVVSKCGRN